MLFHPTKLPGVLLVEPELKTDPRGFFARIFCARELEQQGVTMPVAQANLAFSLRKGTVRGLHYQLPPAAETKLVLCVSGTIFDVAVDMRPNSDSYLKWMGVELSAANRAALLIPPMVAHGYQCLVDNCEVMYLVDQFYAPGMEQGVRFNDSGIGIQWPLEPCEVTARDSAWPLIVRQVDGKP